MFKAFPKFSESGSDGDVEVVLCNPEGYKRLPSGILLEDIISGVKGPEISKNANQKVTIHYWHYAQDTKLIRKGFLENSITEFADEFIFKADFTGAVAGMKLCGCRRIIIPPDIRKARDYRIVDVLLQNIEEKGTEEVSSKEKTERVNEVEESKEKTERVNEVEESKEKTERVNEVEESKEKNNHYNKYVKVVDDLRHNIGPVLGSMIATSPVLNHMYRGIKVTLSKKSRIRLKDIETFLPEIPLDEETMYSAQNTYNNETKPQPKVHSDEETMYPAQNTHNNEPQPKPKVRFDEETMYPARNTYINETKPQPKRPKVTYLVLDEGEGEVISKYRQRCFEYTEADSKKAISFEGSAIELAAKLGQGFGDAMLEAIVGMKVNESRIISIPRELSGLEKNTVIKLKLKSINQWSKM